MALGGCEECLQVGSQWVHLRLCLGRGHVGVRRVRLLAEVLPRRLPGMAPGPRPASDRDSLTATG
jgi:hypothetical protein